MNTRRYEGKVVVVTGGGQGMGYGIARRLADEGASVAVLELNQETGQQIVKDIEASGGKALLIGIDVTNKGQVDAAFGDIVKKWGKIDALVNVVGWAETQLFMTEGPDYWDKVIDINYKAVVYCCRAALEYMISAQSGHIVSISSDSARHGTTGVAVYAGAKAAIHAFSKSVAREVARYKITLNVVSPGLTDTPQLRRHLEESGDQAAKIAEAQKRGIPLRRIGTPDDIAAAVAFLASDEADYITGQVLSVSGGVSMVD